MLKIWKKFLVTFWYQKFGDDPHTVWDIPPRPPPPPHTQKNNIEGMDQKSRLLTKSDQKHFPKLLTLESDQNFFQNY